MTHRLNFITGLVMLIVAGTLAFTISRSPSRTGLQLGSIEITDNRDTVKKAVPRLPSPLIAESSGLRDRSGKFQDSPSRPAAHATRPGGSTSLVHPGLKVEVRPSFADDDASVARAKQVERHAIARLAQLTEALELTPRQQERIFPVLVRSSQSFDPSMRIVTDPAASDAEASGEVALNPQEEQSRVQEELTPVQRDQLIEHSMTDLLLWEEIIGDLSRQLELAASLNEIPEVPADSPVEETPQATPAATVVSPLEEPPAAVSPPASRGGRNLFEDISPTE